MVIQQIHPVATWFGFLFFLLFLLFSLTYQNRHLYLLSEVLTFGFFKSSMLRHGPSLVCSVYVDNAGTFPECNGHGGAKLDTVLNVNVNESSIPVIVCDTWIKVAKTIQAPKSSYCPLLVTLLFN